MRIVMGQLIDLRSEKQVSIGGRMIAYLPDTIAGWLTIIHKYLYNWIKKDDDGKINGFMSVDNAKQ